MSLELGHSRNNMNCISSGKNLPSLTEFIYICEYFKITPEQFFDAKNKNPAAIEDITQKAKVLGESDLALVASIIDRL